MSTITRKRRDKMMRDFGWTHRLEYGGRDPYLKLFQKETLFSDEEGATFTDQEGRFHYYSWDRVVAL